MASERMRLSLRSYPEREGAHVHPYHQAVLPLAGVMDIRLSDTAGSVSARQGVIIASGARHVFHASGANRFIVLDMPPAAFPPLERDEIAGTHPSHSSPLSSRAIQTSGDSASGHCALAPQSPFFGLDDSLAQLVRYADAELLSAGLGAEGEFHLAALIAGKIRRYFAAPAPRSAPVERALAVMRERYAERLTMRDLASAAGLGASRLHELFRRETGRTPGEILAQIRLDRAEDLLARTRLPIAEIALSVGFSEQSALTRSLRRRRGTTPAACRRATR
jgi:AraC-like DNA-binding protein